MNTTKSVEQNQTGQDRENKIKITPLSKQCAKKKIAGI